MKIGIISAINMQESKIDWGGSPVEVYARFLGSTGADFEFEGYEAVHRKLPATVEACDAYVITGSPSGAYESDLWITELIQFIQDGYQAGKKFIGICFGHQILAQALGGRVEKVEKGWGLGMKTQLVSQVKPWMNGIPAETHLYYAHQDQVQELPPKAELLGGSDFCPIGLYAIEEQVLGIQGHPEFSEGHIRDVLTQRRIQGYNAEADAAEKSLQNGNPDNEMVAGWIVRFLGLTEIK